MSKAGYSATTTAAVALVAATAKSVLSVIAPAQFGVDLTKFRLGFDGVTASQIDISHQRGGILETLIYAIVDANGPEEQAMGWYYYLDDRIRFPFQGRRS